MNRATCEVTLPEGTGIDLGGIGKGWAVDRMAAILGSPSLVNGGGDVYVSGRPPGETHWRAGIADPFHPEQDLVVLKVIDRGIATSSTLKRSWQSAGLTMHHLIDPRTGRPSRSDAVQVSVVAASALMADYHAKVALLMGADQGLAYINAEVELEGLVVRSNGNVLASDGLSAYQE